MWNVSFSFNKSPIECSDLALELKDILPNDCEVDHAPLKDANGKYLGPYAVWANVYTVKDMYLAYGFFAMNGGQK